MASAVEAKELKNDWIHCVPLSILFTKISWNDTEKTVWSFSPLQRYEHRKCNYHQNPLSTKEEWFDDLMSFLFMATSQKQALVHIITWAWLPLLPFRSMFLKRPMRRPNTSATLHLCTLVKNTKMKSNQSRVTKHLSMMPLVLLCPATEIKRFWFELASFLCHFCINGMIHS